MFSFTESAKEAMLQVPSLSKVSKKLIFFICMFLPFLHPLLDRLSTAAIPVHGLALAVSASDFVMECVKRWWRGTLRSDAKITRATREKLEYLWRYTVDAVRLLFVCAVLVVLGLSFATALLALYSVYLMLWERDLTHLGTAIRWLFVPTSRRSNDATADSNHPTGRPRPTAAPQRASSLKAGSAQSMRIVIMDEGPHFNTRARGCLWGES